MCKLTFEKLIKKFNPICSCTICMNGLQDPDVFETQLLMFQSILIFQSFSSWKAAYIQINSLRTACILTFPSFVNTVTLHFASLLPVLHVLFLQYGLQKYTFQVLSFRIERTVSLSRLGEVLKLISLCNLHPQTKELFWRLLAKTAQCHPHSSGRIFSCSYDILRRY